MSYTVNNKNPTRNFDEENYEAQEQYVLEDAENNFDEDGPESEEENIERPQNSFYLTLTHSLIGQVKYMSHSEGVSIEDLLTELIVEGVAKRVFEDQTKTTPSHLMTRNGYVHSGEHGYTHPQMSHHVNNNRNRPNNGQNRNYSYNNQNQRSSHNFNNKNNHGNSLNNGNNGNNNNPNANNNRNPNFKKPNPKFNNRNSPFSQQKITDDENIPNNKNKKY